MKLVEDELDSLFYNGMFLFLLAPKWLFELNFTAFWIQTLIGFSGMIIATYLINNYKK